MSVSIVEVGSISQRVRSASRDTLRDAGIGKFRACAEEPDEDESAEDVEDVDDVRGRRLRSSPGELQGGSPLSSFDHERGM